MREPNLGLRALRRDCDARAVEHVDADGRAGNIYLRPDDRAQKAGVQNAARQRLGIG